MKILAINSYYPPNNHGGADRSVQLLAEGLHGAGHQVVVVSLASSSRSTVQILNGVKVHYLAVNNKLCHVRNQGRSLAMKAVWQIWTPLHPLLRRVLKSIVERERPDILHTHVLAGFSIEPWSIARTRGIPVVHTLHDYFLLCPRGTMFNGSDFCVNHCRSCRVFVAMRRARASDIDAVISVSKHILNEHLNRGYFDSVPIQTRIFNSSGEPGDHSSISRSNGALRVGFIGRIEPFKGLDVLLDGVRVIEPDKLSLKIAGTGANGFLKKLKRRWPLSNVEYLGRVDPESFFPEIDVLVVPSKYHDPAPRVILEAYLHGVPVLGSNLGGIPELIDNGETGWSFDMSDRVSLSRKLTELVEDSESLRKMKERCRRKAETLSSASMVERHLKVYRQVLGSRSLDSGS